MNRRYESQTNVGSPVARSSPGSVTSSRPMFRIVSSMPGIDTAAPERTDTRSGRRLTAEAPVRRLLEDGHAAPEQLVDFRREPSAVVVVGTTELGRQHECRRHRQAALAHPHQVVGLVPDLFDADVADARVADDRERTSSGGSRRFGRSSCDHLGEDAVAKLERRTHQRVGGVFDRARDVVGDLQRAEVGSRDGDRGASRSVRPVGVVLELRRSGRSRAGSPRCRRVARRRGRAVRSRVP